MNILKLRLERMKITTYNFFKSKSENEKKENLNKQIAYMINKKSK